MAKSGWFILVVLIIAAAVMGYYTFQNFRDNLGSPVILTKSAKSDYKPSVNLNFSSYSGREDIQFYKNMRFNHNDITYRVSSKCSLEQSEKFNSAVDFLDRLMRNVVISQVPWTSDADRDSSKGSSADIDILCGREYLESEDVYVAGEGGPKFVLNSTIFTVIIGGKVILYRDSCSYNVELHELLHVFGFSHSGNRHSIMYNTSYCNQDITGDIINKLNELYSYEALPDLYFAEVSAVKHGIYLDFNVTIKNQGIIDSGNVTLRILGDDGSGDEKIQDFELGGMEYGGGRTLSAQNIKLKTRNTKSVTFVIDPENRIREYGEENNKINMEVRE